MVSGNVSGEFVNLVYFPIEKTTITSGEIRKAQKKIKDEGMPTFYFANGFTLEALDQISESDGRAFFLSNFLWTDESFFKVHER